MQWPQIRAGLIALAIAVGLFDGVQRTTAWPVHWIGERLRVTQRWALYQAPSTAKHRLVVEGRQADGKWRVLFRGGDPAHQEDRELLDYKRPRGAWARVSFMPQQYPLFASWVITRMLAKHPELPVIRVQLEVVTITADGVVPTGTFIETRVRNRDRELGL
jgi:hypothetical protein